MFWTILLQEVEANSVISSECMDRNDESLVMICFVFFIVFVVFSMRFVVLSCIMYSYNLIPTCTQRMLKKTLWMVPLLFPINLAIMKMLQI